MNDSYSRKNRFGFYRFEKKDKPGSSNFHVRVKCREIRIFHFKSEPARQNFIKKIINKGCTVLSVWYGS